MEQDGFQKVAAKRKTIKKQVGAATLNIDLLIDEKSTEQKLAEFRKKQEEQERAAKQLKTNSGAASSAQHANP